jgi:DNA-binding PadR family transcriptional regulator
LAARNEQSALTEGVYLILISMLVPRHGYGVMQRIEELTGGRVALGAGTLYGAINTLLEKGWIVAVDAAAPQRKKEYATSEMGRAVLRGELGRLEELIKIGTEALQ